MTGNAADPAAALDGRARAEPDQVAVAGVALRRDGGRDEDEAAGTEPRSNSDVVRGLYQALAERDMEALSAVIDPAIEIRQSEALPWGRTYRGLEGFHRFFGTVLQYLDSTVAIERLIEAGNQVAVVGRTRGTVRANGRAFDVPVVHLHELRDRHIVRSTILIDTPAMLEALEAGVPAHLVGEARPRFETLVPWVARGGNGSQRGARIASDNIDASNRTDPASHSRSPILNMCR